MPWTKSLGLQFSNKTSIRSFERVNIQIKNPSNTPTIFYLRSHLCGCRNGMLDLPVLPRMNSASNTNALAFQRQISTLVPSWCTSSWKNPTANSSLIPFVPEHLSCTVWWKKIDLVALPIHPWNANLCQLRTRGVREVSMNSQACLQHAGGLN